MDDLLLFTPMRQSHFDKLEDLLKTLCKNGLKISPKKCQLFKTELQYVGNTIFIKDRKVHVRPLRSQLEAIQKLKPPTTPKGCRSFALYSVCSGFHLAFHYVHDSQMVYNSIKIYPVQ